METAMKIIQGNNFRNMEISILGKLDPALSLRKEKIDKISRMETHWKDLLGDSPNPDFFNNPEIGTVFIVGFLVPTFLHDVEGKALGVM